MKILVVGSGGREHAIVRTLLKSSRRDLKIYCAPGNAGIALSATCVPIEATDIDSLAVFSKSEGIDLTIVGGEASLAVGIVDLFQSRGLALVGPTVAAARLESSKAFAKDFMARHGIPTARYMVASSPDEAHAFLKSGGFDNEQGRVVVKADGLAAGKGVVVANTFAEAAAAINSMMVEGSVGNEAAKRIVIEEALVGVEVSLLLFADGNDYALMPAARDHKRIGEGDTGPNTGGMGVVTYDAIIDKSLLDRVLTDVVKPTLAGAVADGFPFRGILFIGLMITPEGPSVLEYNVRFGDPEAQAILVRLRSDFVQLCESMAKGTLRDCPVQWANEPSACVVLASRGYPGKPVTGDRITGLEGAEGIDGVEVFHAGTRRSDDGEWLTAGGRVLGVTATASTLEEALRHCYDTVGKINWDGMQYRRDIGAPQSEIGASKSANFPS